MFYVLDEKNNRVEAFDKEGTVAAIEKAIADGSLADLVADAAFVTKLKCCVSGETNKMAFVSQAKINELVSTGALERGTVYFVTDDITLEEIDLKLTEIENTLAEHSARIDADNSRITRGYVCIKVKEYTEEDDYYRFTIVDADGLGCAEGTELYAGNTDACGEVVSVNGNEMQFDVVINAINSALIARLKSTAGTAAQITLMTTGVQEARYSRRAQSAVDYTEEGGIADQFQRLTKDMQSHANYSVPRIQRNKLAFDGLTDTGIEITATFDKGFISIDDGGESAGMVYIFFTTSTPLLVGDLLYADGDYCKVESYSSDTGYYTAITATCGKFIDFVTSTGGVLTCYKVKAKEAGTLYGMGVFEGSNYAITVQAENGEALSGIYVVLYRRQDMATTEFLTDVICIPPGATYAAGARTFTMFATDANGALDNSRLVRKHVIEYGINSSGEPSILINQYTNEPTPDGIVNVRYFLEKAIRIAAL